MNQAGILKKFQEDLVKAQKLITSAHKQSAAGSFVLNEYERTVITESAYLRIFIYWEKFLEDSLVAYMLGKKSINGKVVTCCVQPKTQAHARDMAKGAMRYFDWSDTSKVKTLAKLYFKTGEPYVHVISSVESALTDMKTIRNSSAHITTSTAKQLDALATRVLQKPVIGISVYDLILSPDPRSPAGATVLDYYVSSLVSASIGIANK
jgi:hypothetical protein